jgi:hypothetical protein
VWLGPLGWFGPSYPEAGDPPASGASDPAEQDGDMPDLDELDTNGPPPRRGPGSSRSIWLVYAHTNDVTVPDDASQGDIIAACAKAGVRTD